MKTPEIFFRVIGDSGPLSIYWYPGPYGDAVEAIKGNGVGWFAPNGELLGVEFDDVRAARDHELLEFKSGISVEVFIKKSKVRVHLYRPQSRNRKAASG